MVLEYDDEDISASDDEVVDAGFVGSEDEFGEDVGADADMFDDEDEAGEEEDNGGMDEEPLSEASRLRQAALRQQPAGPGPESAAAAKKERRLVSDSALLLGGGVDTSDAAILQLEVRSGGLRGPGTAALSEPWLALPSTHGAGAQRLPPCTCLQADELLSETRAGFSKGAKIAGVVARLKEVLAAMPEHVAPMTIAKAFVEALGLTTEVSAASWCRSIMHLPGEYASVAFCCSVALPRLRIPSTRGLQLPLTARAQTPLLKHLDVTSALARTCRLFHCNQPRPPPHPCSASLAPPPPPPPAQDSLTVKPPASVAVVGSAAYGALARPDPTIDIAVQLPTDFLAPKAHLNYRYHARRAAYLVAVAAYLRDASYSLYGEQRIECLHGDPTRPALVIRPATAEGYSLRLLPAIAPDTFALPRLAPDRNGVRAHTKEAKGQLAAGGAAREEANGAEAAQQQQQLLPTPHYNAGIVEDMMFSIHAARLKVRARCVAFLCAQNPGASSSPPSGGCLSMLFCLH